MARPNTRTRDWRITVELRTINNRYFKFSLRSTEGYGLLEPQIEGVIRERIKRGTVQATLRVTRLHAEDTYSLNLAVLRAYHVQLDQYYQQHHMPLMHVGRSTAGARRVSSTKRQLASNKPRRLGR